jgi:general secretion pathway protein D
MLEMEVLEVTRSRMQELGIQYPNQLAVATPAGATALTLEALHNLTRGGVNVSPNPAVNFNKTSGDVNLLANPRIRVRNNSKAKVHVGDKVPVITTTSTANVGVSESVQYLDVGLKLEVEPRITLDDHVNIMVSLEVASIVKTISTNNGGLVYQLGTRNASTLLRLKDGETQVLAGLISDEERENAKKLPGLGDIPLIGRLFSSQKDEKNKTEIVLAITPRIISNISRPESDIQEYWSGTETGITDRPQIVVPGGAATGNTPRTLPQRQLLPAPEPEPVQEQPAASEPPRENSSASDVVQPAVAP